MTTTVISGSLKMAEVIASDPRTMALMPRFGIDLGFGEKTVNQICREKSIPLDFFLLMANTFLHPDYFPNRKLRHVDVKLLLVYLENSHEHYIKEKIPYLQSLVSRYTKDLPALEKAQLQTFFDGYIQEVIDHIDYEEKVVFPYICELIGSAESDPETKSSGKYSIKEFEEKHDDIEEKLSDLRSLLVKYFPHDINRHLRILILNELFDLEQDLVNHARLEDKVLIPIIKELETAFGCDTDTTNDARERILHHLNSLIEKDTEDLPEPSDNLLSLREMGVLKLLVKGKSNKEVSNELFISPHTVMTHRKNISRKLQIRSLAGLTVYAIINGIIGLEDFK